MAKKDKKKALSCVECNARCCRYIATQIDDPDGKQAYDHIRWYLLHKDVFVFIDHEGDWYLEFATDCDALGEDGCCTNYDGRPRLCRIYGETEALCEFHTDDKPYDVRFSTAAEFEAWLHGQGIKWRWKKG